MNKLITIVVILLISNISYSQLKEDQHFPGVCLGFWVHGSSPTLGINYDYQMKQAGIGIFSIGGILRYWRYTQKYSDGDSWDYTNIAFGFQANYNFNQIGNGTFAPYVGLVLGYDNIGTKYTRFETTTGIIRHDAIYNSAIQLWVQAGFRYFFNPRLAGTFRLGLGNLDFSEIELGVDYRF
jgi:hypothetical protein